MKMKPTLLLHPALIVSVFALLLNDFYLKPMFHNWFTGKFSDFAGLFAFTIFWLAILPFHRRIVVATVVLFFLWWKSSLSAPFIVFLNYRMGIPIDRIVDHTDYIAIITVPLTFFLKPWHYNPSLLRTAATWCVAIISFFAFTATTMLKKLTDDQRVKADKYVRTKKSEAKIITTLSEAGLKVEKDSAIYERVWNDDFYIKQNKEGQMRMIPLKDISTGIYKKIDYGSVYSIPKIPLAGDTIYNLQLMIYGVTNNKNNIMLHSYETRRKDWDSSSRYSLYEWEKFNRPLKKKFRKMLR
jgi:hypothetical protein